MRRGWEALGRLHDPGLVGDTLRLCAPVVPSASSKSGPSSSSGAVGDVNGDLLFESHPLFSLHSVEHGNIKLGWGKYKVGILK